MNQVYIESYMSIKMKIYLIVVWCASGAEGPGSQKLSNDKKS